MSLPHEQQRVTILDLLDRILTKGILAQGDLAISVAGVDLLYLGLKALLTSSEQAERMRREAGMPPPPPRPTLPPLGAFQPLAPPQPSLAPDRGSLPASPPDRSLVDMAEQVERASAAWPARLAADPENVERGLAKLVLTVIELLRRLLERQAIHRIDAGSLSDEEIERLGLTFQRLEWRMEELKRAFGLEGEDLNLDLGPLGDLM